MLSSPAASAMAVHRSDNDGPARPQNSRSNTRDRPSPLAGPDGHVEIGGGPCGAHEANPAAQEAFAVTSHRAGRPSVARGDRAHERARKGQVYPALSAKTVPV